VLSQKRAAIASKPTFARKREIINPGGIGKKVGKISVPFSILDTRSTASIGTSTDRPSEGSCRVIPAEILGKIMPLIVGILPFLLSPG
jgi:hypothetical protein